MYKIANTLQRWFPFMRRFLNRIFYQYLATLDKHGRVTLMNYGYVDLNDNPAPFTLKTDDQANRHSLRLYHQVASAVDLTGFDVLEVGSGRGGGASYVHRYLNPKTITGVDYAPKAISFCRRKYQIDGLHFVQGDAENLPFDPESFNAVINVESSHCYGSMKRFISEVARVLRPGGYFLWADFRPPVELPDLITQLADAGFKLVEQERITPNIIHALDDQAEQNRTLIKEVVPALVRPWFYHFAGVEGSMIKDRFLNNELEYMRLALQKG